MSCTLVAANSMEPWVLIVSGLPNAGSGRQAGQFQWAHNIAVDSKGNIDTTDNARRTQKFVAR